MKNLGYILVITFFVGGIVFLNNLEKESKEELKNTLTEWSSATTNHDYKKLIAYSSNSGIFFYFAKKLNDAWLEEKDISYILDEVNIIDFVPRATSTVECQMRTLHNKKVVNEEKIIVNLKFEKGVWKLENFSIIPKIETLL